MATSTKKIITFELSIQHSHNFLLRNFPANFLLQPKVFFFFCELFHFYLIQICSDGFWWFSLLLFFPHSTVHLSFWKISIALIHHSWIWVIDKKKISHDKFQKRSELFDGKNTSDVMEEIAFLQYLFADAEREDWKIVSDSV